MPTEASASRSFKHCSSAAGEKVYAGARDPATVEVTDDRVRPVRLDVTDPSRMAELGEELADVRLVVNNAGIARPASPLGANQLRRMGAGTDPDASYGTRRALLSALRAYGIDTLRRRRG